MASVKPLHCNMCNGYLKEKLNLSLCVILGRHMTTLTRGEEVLRQEEGILLFQPSSLSSESPALPSYHNCHHDLHDGDIVRVKFKTGCF